MLERRAALETVIEKLQQERDALRVKMHLAGMDAKDEYERISSRVDDLKTQFEPFTGAVGDTASNVFAALGLAADELRLGFGRVRKAIGEKSE